MKVEGTESKSVSTRIFSNTGKKERDVDVRTGQRILGRHCWGHDGRKIVVLWVQHRRHIVLSIRITFLPSKILRLF